MGFSTKIKEELFVKCARHCCVCIKPVGSKIEIHHIIPKSEGGEDSFENAIALCFNCHADAGHYNVKHPKGSKFSPSELRKHKENWITKVATLNIKDSNEQVIEILSDKTEFSPIFVREETRFIDKKSMHRVYELTGEDPMDFVRKRIEENTWNSLLYMPGLNSVKTYDEYLDFISSDETKLDDVSKDIDCQPLEHCFYAMKLTNYIELNKSNCVINLSLKNVSDKPLEDFKLYITLNGVVNADSVNKQRRHLDATEYFYNIHFDENLKGEFNPDQKVLVQNDTVKIDSICFRIKPTTKEVKLHWELFARDVNVEGQVILDINPKFEEEERTKYVNSDEVKDPIVRILPKFEFG